MRRWRLRMAIKGPTLAHCWEYGELVFDTKDGPKKAMAGWPLCGVNSVPQNNWKDLQPGEAWCAGFCKRCAKKQHIPEAGESGTTR